MAQKKKKENSVNLTEKNKSYTRIEKNNKVNSFVKKEIKEENSNKKIIIVALVLAILIAVLCYWKGCVNKVEEDNNNTEQKEEINDEENELEEENSESVYENNYVYEVVPVIKEENEEEIIDVVPEVEEIYYSLTFESNGGSNVETQILGINEVTTYELPTKEGWIFAGWFVDSSFNEEYIFDTHLTEDITVYAKWIKNVRYQYNQELLEDINVVTLGEEVPLLSSDDERFDIDEKQELGWFAYSIDDETEPFEILPGTILDEEIANKFDEEIILEARFLTKFDMTFNYKVEIISEEVTPEDGNIVETVELDEVLSDEIEPTIIDEEIILEVVEGRKIPFDEVHSSINEKYTEFTEKEYGWYYIYNNVVYDLPSDSVANTLITEVYMGDVVTITYVEREVNEETGEYVDKEIAKENIVKDSHIQEDNIFVPEEKEGQEFVGWFPEIDEEGTVGDDALTSDTIIDEDKTFVGRWEEIIEDTSEEENLTVTESAVETEEDLNEDLELNDSEIDEQIIETQNEEEAE